MLLRRWALSFNPLPRAEVSCLVNFFSNFMSTGDRVCAAVHEYGVFLMCGLCCWLLVCLVLVERMSLVTMQEDVTKERREGAGRSSRTL